MMNKLFRIGLMGVLLVVANSLFALPVPAFADCTPSSPADGATVICTGTDSNGLSTPSDNVDVYVTTGATVSNHDNHAINISDTPTIINEGTITGTGNADAVKAGENGTVINNGDINSIYNDGVDIGNNATVINNGTISTGFHDGTSHGDKGVEADNGATIENNGTIHASGDGVYVGASSYVTNNGTIISDGEEGVQGGNGTVVDNYGTISTGMSNAYDGVEVESYGTVNNYGTIEGYCDGVDVDKYSQVINDGTIYAETCIGVDTGMGAVVVNTGTISTGANAQSGVELDFNGVVINMEGGSIEGSCRGVRGTASGAVIENYGEIHGESCDGVDINGSGEIYNYGEITAGGFGDAGVEVDAGYIENNGTIDGGSNGIKLAGTNTAPTTIVNNGLIIGKEGIDALVSLGSQNVINNGTIIGTGGSAIAFGAGNDSLSTAAGARIDGLIDGGEGADLLEFRYRFEATSFYKPAEYLVMEQTVLSAPTTGCPCVIDLVISGKSYRYLYTNMEQLKAFFDFVQLQYNEPEPGMYSGNGVTAYALNTGGYRTGQISVYHTETGEGVLVTTFNPWNMADGQVITGTDSWKVVFDHAAMEGSTKVVSMSVVDADGSVRATLQVLLLSNGATAWR